MPRASSERPARRLDAILQALKRNGIRRFKAAKLDGIGEGIDWVFGGATAVTPSPPPARRHEPTDPDLLPGHRGNPIDELDLVAEGREGPVSETNGVS